MDKMIYVAMTAARGNMRVQSNVSHNLANAATTGFRAMQHSMQSAPVPGDGFPTRVNTVMRSDGWDARLGTMISTGRNLDVAIRGDGWLSVQAPDGQEAYTRAGNLRVTPAGMLETANGHLVLGNGGPISLPPYQKITIGGDGQISIVPQGQKPSTIADVDRLKLVNPEPGDLVQSGDGLFRVKADAAPPEPDASVVISSGQLESSNVNPAEALVQMIELSRDYELHIRAMHVAEENDESASRLMRMNG